MIPFLEFHIVYPPISFRIKFKLVSLELIVPREISSAIGFRTSPDLNIIPLKSPDEKIIQSFLKSHKVHSVKSMASPFF